jgi:hypothetical protein
MALLIIDPFDQYGSLTELAKNYAINGPFPVLDTVVRSGATVIKMFGQVGSPSIDRPLPAAQSNLFWHCSHMAPKMPDNSNSIAINNIPATFGWHLYSAGALRLSFVFDNLGRLCVYSGTYATLLGRSNQVLFTNAWAAFEFHVTGGVNGTVEIRRNEQLVLLLSNVDTRGGGAGSYDTIRLGRAYDLDADTGPYYYDDFLCWNNLAGNLTDFIGPRRLRTLAPKNQANVAGWAAKDGGTLWGSLDNIPSDPVNHYIAAGAAGATADFGMTPAPKNCSNVAAIVALVQARADGGGSVGVDLIDTSGEVIPGTSIGLGVSDSNNAFVFPSHNNGVPFTIQEVNKITARLKRTA